MLIRPNYSTGSLVDPYKALNEALGSSGNLAKWMLMRDAQKEAEQQRQAQLQALQQKQAFEANQNELQRQAAAERLAQQLASSQQIAALHEQGANARTDKTIQAQKERLRLTQQLKQAQANAARKQQTEQLKAALALANTPTSKTVPGKEITQTVIDNAKLPELGNQAKYVWDNTRRQLVKANPNLVYDDKQGAFTLPNEQTIETLYKQKYSIDTPFSLPFTDNIRSGAPSLEEFKKQLQDAAKQSTYKLQSSVNQFSNTALKENPQYTKKITAKEPDKQVTLTPDEYTAQLLSSIDPSNPAQAKAALNQINNYKKSYASNQSAQQKAALQVKMKLLDAKIKAAEQARDYRAKATLLKQKTKLTQQLEVFKAKVDENKQKNILQFKYNLD